MGRDMMTIEEEVAVEEVVSWGPCSSVLIIAPDHDPGRCVHGKVAEV